MAADSSRRGCSGHRRAAASLAGLMFAAVSMLAAGCAGSAGAQAAPSARPHRTTSQPVTPAPTATPVRSPSPTPSAWPSVISVPAPPGYLHQTTKFPSARTRVFRAEMTDLWAAVATGRVGLASQAFFPLSAYKQVKAIYDPSVDWHDRLFEDFRLDVSAAHRLLGRQARHTSLVRVIVPSAEAAWINPGVCANSVGYWHVGGARLVYREYGELRSIGIASLISWRGRWYVVHFGAVLRGGTYGIVDEPTVGSGQPGPAGGC
ncbi:MAG TPA: hypothetical protein VMV07_08910 [Streptosporangiaceae bacterium]|nr:hypothetical protein [Streptosporangiaceae bacterium]